MIIKWVYLCVKMFVTCCWILKASHNIVKYSSILFLYEKYICIEESLEGYPSAMNNVVKYYHLFYFLLFFYTHKIALIILFYEKKF